MHYVKCTHCDSEYKVAPDLTGKSIKCQACNQSFKVLKTYQKKRKPAIEELAVIYKLITNEQLMEAISIQQTEEQLGKKTSLTDIFLQKKMMDKRQLNLLQDISKFLELRTMDKQFGKIAIKKGMLSEREINLALSVQEVSFKKHKYCRLIGDILVEAGVMNVSQRDMILEEQKRADQLIPTKEGDFDNASINAKRQMGGLKAKISNFRHSKFRAIIHFFTLKKALIVISAIILITAGLMMYASTLKPKNYRQFGKRGLASSFLYEKNHYKYPLEFSTTLKDFSYFHIEMEIEFDNINGFEEFNAKLPRILHAFNLVYAPRRSDQIKSKSKISNTLKKILSSQMDITIRNVRVTKYIVTEPESGELIEPKKELPDFSF